MGALLTCYNCKAVVPSGLSECPTCGAEQSKEAKKRHLEIAIVKKKSDNWRLAAIVGAGLAFLGFAWAGLQGGDNAAARQVEQAQADSIRGRLSLPEVTDAFIRAVNRHFEKLGAGFEILGWLPLQSGGVVLELMPPTSENPIVFWQAINAEDRREVMTFLSVSYTKMLLEEAVWPEGTEGTFPIMALQYRGTNSPLAIRRGDGQIQIFASPYDSLYAPLMNRMQGAQARPGAVGPGQ